MDDYHKEIVGYAVHETLETKGCLSALDMALKKTAHKRTQRLIHHSDRGTQYASTAYVTKLKANGIEVSMTENGNPKENAASERINNTVKNELLKGERFSSVRQVRETLAQRIRFYNEERPHMSLDMRSPLECRQMTGVINKGGTGNGKSTLNLKSELRNMGCFEGNALYLQSHKKDKFYLSVEETYKRFFEIM